MSWLEEQAKAAAINIKKTKVELRATFPFAAEMMRMTYQHFKTARVSYANENGKTYGEKSPQGIVPATSYKVTQ